jgi:DNA-binding NtrC family response regulator
MGKPHLHLEPSAMAELADYRWPGNARELRNVIERAVMLSTQDTIPVEEIKNLLPSGRSVSSAAMPSYMSEPYMKAKRKILAEFTTAYVKSKLALHDGHISKAAEDSGIPRQHFSLLMKRYLEMDA